MTFRHILSMVTVVSALLLFTGQSNAKIYLDVDEARATFPIAIQPFQNPDGGSMPSAAADQILATIAGDLSFTGLFKVINPESFLENPATAGVSADEINFQSWSLVGAQGLLTGRFWSKQNRIIVEVKLFDVQQGRFLAGRRYVGEMETARRIGHKISNLVYTTLTNEPSIFESKISFVSDQTGQKEVYIIDYDGYNSERFSFHGSITLSPKWSPDGSAVAFTSYKNRKGSVYVKEYVSREERVLTQYPDLNVSAAWSPNAQELALTLSKDGNPEIYIVNAQGAIVRRLTNNWGIDVSPTWSPDGESIAFVSNRAGSPQLFIMDKYGNNVRRLTFKGSYNADPDWSSRGDKIAYSSIRNGSFQICTINPDGTEDMQLTWEGGNECPRWSSNGRHLVFVSTRSGGKQIYTMLANGTNVQRLTKAGLNYSPDWSPNVAY